MRREIFVRAGAFFLILNMVFWMLPIGLLTARAEGGDYITEITLMEGNLSALSLEESGYNVIEQPLNLTGSSNLYLGYRTGGEGSAIRDLVVSSSGSGSIEVDGHSYQKVSDVSLNTGAGGSSLYLYASYDSETGGALRGLSFFVKKSDTFSDDSPVLASDGSEVVTSDNGKVADLDEGIGGSELYLRMYKGNLYMPYVERVVVATAGSEEDAIAELAGKGCTYYVNYDIGDDKCVFVGYTRTDDEKKALRALIAIGGDEEDIQKQIEKADNPEEAGDGEEDGAGEAETEDVGENMIRAGANEGEIEFHGVSYAPVEGGEVKSDQKYTFYMTTDERVGEPIMDLVAFGYDPAEFGLENLGNDEEAEETEEETETEETTETEEQEKQEGSDEAGESDDATQSEYNEGGEGSDEAEPETVSSVTSGNRALGRLCMVGLNLSALSSRSEPVEKVAELESDSVPESNDEPGDASNVDEGSDESAPKDETEPDAKSDNTPSESEDESEDESKDEGEQEEVSDGDDKEGAEGEEKEEEKEDKDKDKAKKKSKGLAKAYRIYTEISTKDWVTGYFLRGGSQTVSKYLYEESGYMSASESDETLWISNIYGSDKKGAQFTNCIGYVTSPGETEADPFEVTLSYDEAKESPDNAESTASVFGMGISQLVICGMIGVILVGVIASLGYKLRTVNRSNR